VRRTLIYFTIRILMFSDKCHITSSYCHIKTTQCTERGANTSITNPINVHKT